MHINKPARSAQFTPGPWVGYTNTDEGRHIISEAYAQDVIVCEQVHTDADISIIAAAPVMYADLRIIRDYLYKLYDDGNMQAGEYAASLDTTLAQAEGRQV